MEAVNAVNGNRKLHTSEKGAGVGLTLFGWFRSGERGWTKGAQRPGEEAFSSDLADDAEFWAQCEERWGQGAGYRDDVADMVETWFESPEREQLHSSAERKIRSAWSKRVIKPLRRLLD